jgi:hypothetical protein
MLGVVATAALLTVGWLVAPDGLISVDSNTLT